VIVFFVLSGLVIAASVDRGGQTLGSYAVARVARIVALALPALTISLVVVMLDRQFAPVPLFGEDARGTAPLEMLSALLFLSESYQTGFALNPPYWSLCYEVWFYALFPAATFLDGWKRAVWLGGAFVVVALSSLFAVPLVTRPLQHVLHAFAHWSMAYSIYALSDLLLGICIALGFAGLRALTLGRGRWLDRVAGPVRYATNISFSLYLVHWPLLKLLRVLRAPENGAVGFVFVLAVILLASAFFAAMTSHHQDRVRALLERALRASRETQVAA
jgi:peptidoglycan/LPS O-acetylase OafA/YrhL